MCRGSHGWACTEEAIASCMGSAFWFREVGCIVMGPQHHVTCSVVNNSMWMCGTIVEQLGECLHGGLRVIGLLGG